MRKPSILFAVVALLAIAVAWGAYAYSTADAQDKEKPKEKTSAAEVTKWEYRVVVVHLHLVEEAQKELNKLGEEGFEIAFVTGSHRSQSNGARAGAVAEANPVIYYTLKRVKK